MPHVIAIFGKSCVGKSVVAQKLASSLNLPVRHCGEVVKTRAKELGVQVSILPAAEHKAIDEETRALVEGCRGSIIIEGNFLDAVLDEIPHVFFIHLICEDQVREERFIRRSNNQVSGRDFSLRDASDAAHRKASYNSPSQVLPALTINTTWRTVDDIVEEILGQLENKLD